MVKARSKDGHEIERNISHFKKIPKSNGDESDESDDEYDKDIKANASDAQIANDKNEEQTRRSTRVRRVLERYGQTLPSNIINEVSIYSNSARIH